MKTILGYTLIALPFIVLLLLIARDIGWRWATLVFVLCFAAVLCVYAGVMLVLP